MKRTYTSSNRKLTFVIKEDNTITLDSSSDEFKCRRCDASYCDGKFCACVGFECHGNKILKIKDQNKMLSPNRIIVIDNTTYIVTKGKCKDCDLSETKCKIKYFMCKGDMALKKVTSEGL